MSFIPVPNTAEAVLQFTNGVHEMANVLNFLFPTTYSQADLDALSQVVDAWVGVSYLPLVGSTSTYQNTHVRGLTSAIDMSSDNNVHAGTGAAPGSPLPTNATACITARTGFTGRSARGRFYAMPSTTSNQFDDLHWNALYVNTLASALNTLKTDAGTEGWGMVVVSRQHAGVPLTTGVPRLITTWQARNNTIDSMRTRLVGN